MINKTDTTEIFHKAVAFTKQTFTEDDQFYYFEGYASTFGNKDLGGDIVAKGAFTQSLKDNPKPYLLYQHDMRQPVGVTVSAKETDEGLFYSGKMPKGNRQCDDINLLLKCGAIDSMSIGYMVTDFDYDADQSAKILKQINLIEVSLVTMPMNPKATITSVKSVTPFGNLPLADKDQDWDSSKAENNVRKYADAVEEPNSKYAKAFMYYDETNKDKFGAYKLPFADVLDGQLKAVPRAIFAIAAVLNGGRGGVDIPADDKDKIKGIISKYYSKMGMETPFKAAGDELEKKDIEEFDCMKDIENFLKAPYPLTQGQRKALIAKIKSFGQLRDVEDKKAEALGRDVQELTVKVDDLIKGIGSFISVK
jgi:HK97 family phage prohead protease